jgi:YbbR domain-containing protein
MSLRELILNNFWLKGFSAVLATLIWLALSQSEPNVDSKPTNPLFPSRTKERDVLRAVSVLKSPSEQRALQVEPEQVTVRVSGDGPLIDQLNPEDIHAYVNVGALKDPQGSLKVEVHVPRRISVDAISPAQVDVRLAGAINANPASTNQPASEELLPSARP